MIRKFKTQLDFISVIKISAILGFGNGIIFSFFTVIPFLKSGEWLAGVVVFFLTPFASALGAVSIGVIGFPFYYWYCSRVNGQLFYGKFAEESYERKI